MTDKTKSQIEAENAILRTRLANAEADLARRFRAGGSSAAAVSAGSSRGLEPLKASEVRYRRLFETAKDGILILDAGTGEIADSNPFLEQMLGYSHEELAGKKLWEIGSFRDIAASQASFQELQSREYIRYEDLPLETKSGDRRQVEFISNLYLVDGVEVIQCNVRDITARKQAEALVQQAHEQLSSLVTALQRRDGEMTLLNRMNELLQTCETQEEAYRVIALLAAELFTGQGGCLAIFRSSGQYLDTVARWGAESLVEDVFPMEDCWAMRRGRPHEVLDPKANLLCTHFVRAPERGYLCLPLTVQGETLGVLHLEAGIPIPGDLKAVPYRLAVTVGEAIKLSLANLKLRKRLHEQATRDPLTGLFNRRYLEDTLPRELHRTLRRQAPLCVAMLDLDHFKRFNDSFSHEAGDLVLRETGRVLQENLRRSDIACRYGGEEFVLVLPDSSMEDTGQRLEQIRRYIEALEVRHGGQLLAPITVSAGMAAAPNHGTDAEPLLRAADAALYAAKQAGRNRVVAFGTAGPEDDRTPVAQSGP